MDEKTLKLLRSKLQKASMLLRNGQLSEAGALYDEVADQAESNVILNVELGHLCSHFGANDKAAKHYSIAVENGPDDARYLGFLGVARLMCGEIDEAFQLLTKAHSLDTQNSLVVNGLGMVCFEQADFIRARDYFETALKSLPGEILILINLAKTLVELNEHEKALDLARSVIRSDPSLQAAHYLVGRILTETGRTQEAVRHFEKLIRRYGTAGVAYDYLARLKKFTTGDRALINKAEKALTGGMPPIDRLCIHFALGKMHDDCGDYAKALDNYRQANLLQKRPYDSANDRRWFRQQTRAFTARSIAGFSETGHESEQPIFIVGMPRSGTTLMERIIASHSKAAGAGELPTLASIAHQILDEKERLPAAAAKACLTRDRQRSLAEEYLGVLNQGREGKQRIVDKLPGNYQHVGVIASLFPRATIIYSRRNPLDTCLSCFFQSFGRVGWANDLVLIANVYRLHNEYMEHWKSVLPAGRILEVEYESLIENPEMESRRMITHCGLDWEPEMLDFHNKEGIVRTVSQWQVRQPIYKTSKRRWTNYPELASELAIQLAELLDDDKELLLEQGISVNPPRRFGWLKLG